MLPFKGSGPLLNRLASDTIRTMPAPLLRRRDLLVGVALFAAAGRSTIRKLTTRKYTIQNCDYLFLEVETDGGITGLGEGSISGRVEIVEKAIEWFTPFLVGKDPRGIEDHWNRNYYELSRYRDGSVLMRRAGGRRHCALGHRGQ